MNLSQLKYAKGSVRRRKRLGVGTGSGRGGTCGRGTKGQKSRSGGKSHPWFEGGQMPLQRRLPKRGFRKRNPLVYQVVNLKDLERVGSGSVVDAAALAAKGLIGDPDKPVKVLGDGEVQGAYAVKVTAASKSARQKIEAAGGSVEVTTRTGPKAGKAGKATGAKATGAKAGKKVSAEKTPDGAGEKKEAEAESEEKVTTTDTKPAMEENPAAKESPAEGNPEGEGQG